MSDTPNPKPGARKPKPSAAAAESRTRRGFGLQAIARTLPKITKTALGRRGFAEADLLAAWTSIVGRDIAARCLPRKLDRPRSGREGEGVLTLRVEAGCALEIQHLEPQLLERINGYMGFRAVGRLRLLQAPGPAAAPVPPAAAPLGAAQEAALGKRLDRVGDDELRAALERLARALPRNHG